MTDSIAWDQVARFYDIYAQATFDLPFFSKKQPRVRGMSWNSWQAPGASRSRSCELAST
jgi:hypothetical protein